MSNPNVDLETVITDSITDSQLPEEPVEVEASEPEDSPEPVETATDDDVAPAEGEPDPSDEVSPEAKSEAPEAAPQDDFARLAGMPEIGPMGRENRIPYSRVKKITEKAVGELAETVLGRKLAKGEKAVDVVKAHVARFPQIEAEHKEYSERLDKVGQFEEVMANDPERFLQMLSRLPAYTEFFQFVRQAYEGQSPVGGANIQTDAAAQQAAASGVTNTETSDPNDQMPEPNDELEDGTRVYNMDGLKALMAWNSRETERRVNRQWESRYATLESRYRPIEAEFQHRKHIESVLPVIQKQIAEAKTWPMFNENEEEITRVLEADQNISLEGAYRKVVFPKLIAARNDVRKQVIQEVKQAPRATSVTGSKVKASPVASNGPRKLEDIIAEQVENLKR